MKITDHELDRAERLLREAHGQRPRPGLPAGWRGRVMAEVNQLAGTGRSALRGEYQSRALAGLLFRLAGAGGLAAAALIAYAVYFGPDLESQAAAFVMDHPGLSQFLGSALWS